MNTNTSDTFSEIYTTYFKRAYFFVKSFVHDDMVAEDITSEALIKLWEMMKSEEVRRIDVLLFTILRAKSLDYLRHEEIKRNAISTLTDWHNRELTMQLNSLDAFNPEEIFSDELRNIIQDTLNQLSKKTQQVFMMSRVEGKSNQEIADQLNISVKCVEYHITKALKIFKVSLREYLPLLHFLLFI